MNELLGPWDPNSALGRWSEAPHNYQFRERGARAFREAGAPPACGKWGIEVCILANNDDNSNLDQEQGGPRLAAL
jgi:hypothetical protein